MAARRTLLPNAFADILEAAADSPGASSASDASPSSAAAASPSLEAITTMARPRALSASHSVNVAPPPKRSDVAPPPPAPKPSDAAPPPKRDDVAPPPPPPERDDDDAAALRARVEALSLENERLRREAGAAAPRSAASKPARSRSCDEDGEAAPRPRPARYSVGAARGRYSVDAALAGRRTSLSLPEPRAGGAAAGPFVAVAIYGAADAAGAVGARRASAYGRYAVAPAELFAECAPGYEATAAALGAFACPDGAPLVAAAPAAALAHVGAARGAHRTLVLRSDGAAALYLSCVTVVSLERVARPGAVRRALDLAAAQAKVDAVRSALPAAARTPWRLPFRTPGGAAAPPPPATPRTTPLAKARAAAAPWRVDGAAAGAAAVVLGERTYAALSTDGDGAGAVVAFLERLAAKDADADRAALRAAAAAATIATPALAAYYGAGDESAGSWVGAWDADSSDDEPAAAATPRCRRGFDDAPRLAKLLRRCRRDGRVFEWLAGPAPPPAPLRARAAAAALAGVRGDALAKVLAALLREESLLVVSGDGARAGVVALGLLDLLRPLLWQGALVMALPADDVGLLQAPVPIVAACSAHTAAAAADDGADGADDPLADVHVLYVDEAGDAAAATLAAAGGADAPPLPCLAAALAARAGDGPGAREARVRAAVVDLLGDLATDAHAWKRCGEENLETGDFDFLPDWFLEPLDAKLALQRGLAHTQMLCSFIHERRDADARAGAA